MTNYLSPFPILNEKRIADLCYESQEYSFFYKKASSELSIEKEKDLADESCFILKATEGDDWNHDEYDLCFSRIIKLSNLDSLFGSSGIACNTAGIGIAVVWTSSDSRQRGVIPVGDFTKKDDDKEFLVRGIFEKGTLRGVVTLRTVFYVKSVGRPLSDETYLANSYGCILGELDSIRIVLDGNGSVFPIMTEENENGPLWRVICDWTNPTEDSFGDSVRIMLNTKHKYYELVEANNGDSLLIEILASAMSIIISKIKDSSFWHDTESGIGFSEGSVCAAVHYFVNTLEWDTSTPEKLSESIRLSLEGKLYNGI